MKKTPKHYNVIVLKRARQMMRTRMNFLARVSQDSARKTTKKLAEAMRSLAQMPGRYPFFNEDFVPQNKYHRMTVERRYLVLYQILDDTVIVDYIIDGREDYGWLFK